MSTTQLLVIGGGPAGLSSALLFARLKRSVIIYDSGKYRNANTLTAHTIPGFEGEDPAKHRAAIRNELKQIEWVDFRWGKIVDSKKVEAEGKGDEGMFVAKDEEGREVRARKVVIATGIKDHLPDIPGTSLTHLTSPRRPLPDPTSHSLFMIFSINTQYTNPSRRGRSMGPPSYPLYFLPRYRNSPWTYGIPSPP